MELVNERSEAPTPNFARLASLSFGPPGVTAGANVGAKAGTNVEVNAAPSSMSDSGLLGGFDDLPPKNDFIELPLDECLLKEEDVVVPLTDAPSCCGSPRVYSEARQAELCSRGFGDGKTVAQNTESSAFWELRTELRYSMSAPVSASDSYHNFLGEDRWRTVTDKSTVVQARSPPRPHCSQERYGWVSTGRYALGKYVPCRVSTRVR